MPTDILLVSIARALVEVAGMFLLGQGVLWIFGPKARDGNFVYDLFKKGTRPIIKLTRIITPRFVHDAHVGMVAFFFLRGCGSGWDSGSAISACSRACSARSERPVNSESEGYLSNSKRSAISS